MKVVVQKWKSIWLKPPLPPLSVFNLNPQSPNLSPPWEWTSFVKALILKIIFLLYFFIPALGDFVKSFMISETDQKVDLRVVFWKHIHLSGTKMCPKLWAFQGNLLNNNDLHQREVLLCSLLASMWVRFCRVIEYLCVVKCQLMKNYLTETYWRICDVIYRVPFHNKEKGGGRLRYVL